MNGEKALKTLNPSDGLYSRINKAHLSIIPADAPRGCWSGLETRN